MKRGIPAVGIDANPASVLASQAKTDWSLEPKRLIAHGRQIVSSARIACKKRKGQFDDPTFEYLETSGMIKRGWISSRPLKKAIALRRQIERAGMTNRYRRLLMLCLASEVVYGASNVKFGPELYCGPAKTDHEVFEGFITRVEQAAADLTLVSGVTPPKVKIISGDSRACASLLGSHSRFSRLVCSPPYPTEHDYTRNTRLELAFFGHVTDRQTLRKVKRGMIRSHTKGIYKGDRDSKHIAEFTSIQKLAKRIDEKVGDTTVGFLELYSEVVTQYFGGMKRHFSSVKRILAPGARCAYVVGDQSSYSGIHIPTAQLLAEIAESVGFSNVRIDRWRGRWSTTRSALVDENILTFSVPDRKGK